MDFSAFSQPDCNITQWINESLSAKEEHESLATHATVLAMKLQLLAQELSNSLEDISAQAVANIPRALREIDRIKRESAALQGSITGMGENLERVEGTTSHSVRLIADFDATKARMIETSEILQQAARLQAFRIERHSILESDDADLLAESLAEARQLSDDLKEIPEFAHMEKELEETCDRVVEKTKSQLDHCIQERDATDVRKHFDLLGKIGRQEAVRTLYISIRKKAFTAVWDEVFVAASSEDTAPEPFEKNLLVFYDKMEGLLREEVQWLSNVLPSDAKFTTISELFSTAMGDTRARLADEISTCLSAAQPSTPFTPLDRLAELLDATERFAGAVRAILSAASTDHLSTVIVAIFEPFFPHVDSFGQSLRKAMSSRLEYKKNMADVIKGIDSGMRQLFLQCDTALQSCLRCTGGSEAMVLLQVLNEVLVQALDRIMSVLISARDIMALPPLASAPLSDRDRSALPPLRIPDDKWARFRLCMTLAQTTFGLTQRLSGFERSMRDQLRGPRDPLLAGTALAMKEGEDGITAHGIASDVSTGLLHMLSRPTQLRKLRTLLHSLDDEHYRLIGGASHRLSQVHIEAQRLVSDAMYHPIQAAFDRYPTLPEWLAVPDVSEYDNVELPSFSLSPTNVVTEIGEYLISLPQQLEPFESTGFPIDMEIVSVSDATIRAPTDSLPTGFGAQWLLMLTYKTLQDFVVRLLEIRRTSPTGRNQMAVDVTYLNNALTALGMVPQGSMVQLSQLLSSPDLNTFQKHVRDIVTGKHELSGTLSADQMSTLSRIMNFE